MTKEWLAKYLVEKDKMGGNVKIAKITIMGNYWDSYIYRDCLFLFDMSKNINIYDWSIIVLNEHSSETYLGLKCAFLNSDYLYKVRDFNLFIDNDFRKLVISKINGITDKLYFKYQLPIKCSIQLDQLPIDIGVYNNLLFYIDSRGFFNRELKFRNKNVISKNETKLSSLKSQSMDIGIGGRILLSASDKGLFEYNYRETELSGYELLSDYKNRNSLDNIGEGRMYLISKEHSTSCSWAFSTIVNNSYFNDPFIYPFKYEKTIDDKYELKTIKKINSKELFDDIDLSKCVVVANNEKIYCIYADKIEGYHYTQKYVGETDAAFRKIITVNINIGESIVSSEVTEFGLVIESITALYVLRSNGQIEKINSEPGEIVKWRVFSRSNCYANQLHVIYKDRIEILSFNDDYFRNEYDEKTIGNNHRYY